MTDEELQKKYDKCPPPGTKLRNAKTGDAGIVVREDDDWFIKPDIPGSPVRFPATQAYNWIVDQDAKKMPPGSYARVAYEAIRTLGEVNAGYPRMPEWLSLHPREKARWIDAKVKFSNPVSNEIYNSIVSILKDH